jgi:hypothetical protein
MSLTHSKKDELTIMDVFFAIFLKQGKIIAIFIS